MYRGYVKLWRKLEDSQIFQNEKALKIWIWILIRANHKENTVLFGRQKILIHKGEFVMGLNKASEHLNLAKSTIHFWVNYLNDLGMVELKKTNKFTLIKIKNWEDYQDGETQMELQKNSKRTLKETNKNEQGIIKNDKEVSVGHFVPPTFEEVSKYCLERNNTVDANKFIDFYQSKGWVVGKTKMKDWQACVRTWEKSSSSVSAAPDLKKIELQKVYEEDFFKERGYYPPK